jgi:HD superfamily phosphohydrolase
MPQLRNSKHEAVLQAFLRDPKRVGWRAYKAVYRKSSQRAAETAWSRLLKDAVFKARLKELTEAVTKAAVDAAVMDLQEVLAELSKLGRANMQDFVVGGDDTAT